MAGLINLVCLIDPVHANLYVRTCFLLIGNVLYPASPVAAVVPPAASSKPAANRLPLHLTLFAAVAAQVKPAAHPSRRGASAVFMRPFKINTFNHKLAQCAEQRAASLRGLHSAIGRIGRAGVSDVARGGGVTQLRESCLTKSRCSKPSGDALKPVREWDYYCSLQENSTLPHGEWEV